MRDGERHAEETRNVLGRLLSAPFLYRISIPSFPLLYSVCNTTFFFSCHTTVIVLMSLCVASFSVMRHMLWRLPSPFRRVPSSSMLLRQRREFGAHAAPLSLPSPRLSFFASTRSSLFAFSSSSSLTSRAAPLLSSFASSSTSASDFYAFANASASSSFSSTSAAPLISTGSPLIRRVKTIADFSRKEILQILDKAEEIKAVPHKYAAMLDKKVVSLLFANKNHAYMQRLVLETAVMQMGGKAIFHDIADEDQYVHTADSIRDFSKATALYAHCIVACLERREYTEAVVAHNALFPRAVHGGGAGSTLSPSGTILNTTSIADGVPVTPLPPPPAADAAAAGAGAKASVPSSIPVLNVGDDWANPLQTLTDLFTLRQARKTSRKPPSSTEFAVNATTAQVVGLNGQLVKGMSDINDATSTKPDPSLEGVRIGFCGDLKNGLVFDLMRVSAILGMTVSLAGPGAETAAYSAGEDEGPLLDEGTTGKKKGKKGGRTKSTKINSFAIPEEVMGECKVLQNVYSDVTAYYETSRSASIAATEADALMTSSWNNTVMESKELDKRRKAFLDFQINAELLSFAKPQCVVLHSLPIVRGDEVSAEVVDGPRSLVWAQHGNKLYVTKALLLKLMNKY